MYASSIRMALPEAGAPYRADEVRDGLLGVDGCGRVVRVAHEDESGAFDCGSLGVEIELVCGEIR
jgi:hypothetical protein